VRRARTRASSRGSCSCAPTPRPPGTNKGRHGNASSASRAVPCQTWSGSSPCHLPVQKSGIWRGAKPLLLPNTHEQTNGDPAGREKKALLPGEVFLVVKTESCRFWALRRINFPRRETGLPARPGFTNGRCHFGQETRSFCPSSPRTGAPIQMSRDR